MTPARSGLRASGAPDSTATPLRFLASELPLQAVRPSATAAAPACVFEDPASRVLLTRVKRIAVSDAGVLIVGAAGTGKERLARQIHDLSPRRGAHLTVVRCHTQADLPLEQQLLGLTAHGGTLVLDEIGAMPMPLQTRLLAMLQQREVAGPSARSGTPADVRVIATSSVDLAPLINAGQFRIDLFYRLNVVQLELRPLQARPGDILPLARHFIAKYSQGLNLPPPRLSGDAERKLLAHAWPGNLRELENAIHQVVLVCSGTLVQADELLLSTLQLVHCEDGDRPASADSQLEEAIQRLLAERRAGLHATVEDTLLRAVYRHCQRNQVRTAEILGLTRNVVRQRLERLGVLVVKRRLPAAAG